MGKISSKPKTYSVDDMYSFHVNQLLKSNPYYDTKYLSREGKVTRFTEVYYVYDKEIEVVEKSIERLKTHYQVLVSNIEGTIDLTMNNEIEDVKISLQSFMNRKKEIKDKARHRKKIIDYKTFKNILTAYNTKAGEQIIEGKKLNLLTGLGYLGGRRVERTFGTKTINWGETNKLRDEQGNLPLDNNGIPKKVYFIDEEWCRVAWIKVKGIKNISVYKFVPSGGQPGKGFRQAFSKAIKDNPLLKLNFDIVKRA